MLTLRKLIPRYVLQGALPYVLLSSVLLTAILFSQQAGRFAEIALNADLPLSLAGEIAAALLPGVLILSLPLAVLFGILIGYARMGSDSELVALRAAGQGTWNLLWPALLIGIFATGVTTFLHLNEVPRAARDLRRAAVSAALHKLESPVEPRTFNTDIPGYVIYVGEGDKVGGSWSRVFIFAQQPEGSRRVVTALSGRIDSSGEKSELVLSDAVAVKFPDKNEEPSYVLEHLDQLRIAIDTGRSALMNRLSQDELNSEELDWSDLTRLASSGSLEQRRDAQKTLHRRLSLSAAPFVFSLFAGLMGLRIRRGGRGAGVLAALVVMIVYYLLALLGESLVRTNSVSPLAGQWMSTAVIIALSLVLSRVRSVPAIGALEKLLRKWQTEKKRPTTTARKIFGIGRSGFPSLLDTNLLRTLVGAFLMGFVALVSIVIIFTLFELWRFIGSNNVPAGVVATYLLFLLPLVAVELFPATMLITVLITYALLARRSEAIAWWASGQSVYRLMIPGLLFAISMGAASWLIQEHVMPAANLRQERLRTRIRGGQPRAITGTGRQWLASPDNRRFYSYEFDEQAGTLNDLAIYELDNAGVHLQRVTSGKSGLWTINNEMVVADVETVGVGEMTVERQLAQEVRLSRVEPPSVFRSSIDKPSHLSVTALGEYLKAAKQRGLAVSALAVALQRKYVTPFSVILMAFIGMPLALAFGRRGAIVALCLAVGVSIVYWGLAGGFQQLGNHGLLPPEVAAWAAPAIFLAGGTYLLSRVKT